MSVKAGAGGAVGFKLKAKNAEMPIAPAQLPTDLAVILDPPHAETGLCGKIEFNGGERGLRLQRERPQAGLPPG